MEPREKIDITIMGEEVPHQAEVEEIVNIMAEVVPQEPTSTVELMEEDGPGQEGLEVEGAVGSTRGENMVIMDGVHTLIQESTFINVGLEEKVPATVAREMLDTGTDVT